jgi:hypothetical protein
MLSRKELIDEFFTFKNQLYRFYIKKIEDVLMAVTNLSQDEIKSLLNKHSRLTRPSADDFMSLSPDWKTVYSKDFSGLNVCKLCPMKNVCQEYLKKNSERVIIKMEDWNAEIKNYSSCHISNHQEKDNDGFHFGFRCVSGEYKNPEHLVCLGFLDNDNPNSYQSDETFDGYYTWTRFPNKEK